MPLMMYEEPHIIHFAYKGAVHSFESFSFCTYLLLRDSDGKEIMSTPSTNMEECSTVISI